METKYVNPFTDFGFKKLFGEEASKPALIDFLNSLLPADTQIKDLSFKNTEQLGQNLSDRKAVYDIYCEGEKGEKFIVELQKAKQDYFRERMLYYATFPIAEQAYLLFEGKILKAGSAEELAEDEQVRRVYLGQNFELKKKVRVNDQ